MLQEKLFSLQVGKIEVQTLSLLLLLLLLLTLTFTLCPEAITTKFTKLHGLLAASYGSNPLMFHRLVLSPSPGKSS
jgi:hypothetical protein